MKEFKENQEKDFKKGYVDELKRTEKERDKLMEKTGGKIEEGEEGQKREEGQTSLEEFGEEENKKQRIAKRDFEARKKTGQGTWKEWGIEEIDESKEEEKEEKEVEEIEKTEEEKEEKKQESDKEEKTQETREVEGKEEEDWDAKYNKALQNLNEKSRQAANFKNLFPDRERKEESAEILKELKGAEEAVRKLLAEKYPDLQTRKEKLSEKKSKLIETLKNPKVQAAIAAVMIGAGITCPALGLGYGVVHGAIGTGLTAGQANWAWGAIAGAGGYVAIKDLAKKMLEGKREAKEKEGKIDNENENQKESNLGAEKEGENQEVGKDEIASILVKDKTVRNIWEDSDTDKAVENIIQKAKENNISAKVLAGTAVALESMVGFGSAGHFLNSESEALIQSVAIADRAFGVGCSEDELSKKACEVYKKADEMAKEKGIETIGRATEILEQNEEEVIKQLKGEIKGEKEEQEDEEKLEIFETIPPEKFRERFEKVESSDDLSDNDMKDLKEHIIAMIERLKESSDAISETLGKKEKYHTGIMKEIAVGESDLDYKIFYIAAQKKELELSLEKVKKMDIREYLKKVMDSDYKKEGFKPEEWEKYFKL